MINYDLAAAAAAAMAAADNWNQHTATFAKGNSGGRPTMSGLLADEAAGGNNNVDVTNNPVFEESEVSIQLRFILSRSSLVCEASLFKISSIYVSCLKILQLMAHNATVQLGGTAFLVCKVAGIDRVSWPTLKPFTALSILTLLYPSKFVWLRTRSTAVGFYDSKVGELILKFKKGSEKFWFPNRFQS